MRELPRSLVLGYHTVSETWDHPAAVVPEQLARQVELLHAGGFRPVTFREAVAGPRDRCVAITFDDAFLAVHEHALPLLTRFGMIATVFVPTDPVSTSRQLAWDGFDGAGRGTAADMRSMSWDHLRDLAAHGWEIGSHTATHPHLRRVEPAVLDRELTASRAVCSAETGVPCTSLAYPYGEVDVRVRAAAQRAGYLAAAGLGPQWRRHDPLWWPRTGIYRDDDLSRFRLKTTRLTQTRTFAAGVSATRRLVGSRA